MFLLALLPFTFAVRIHPGSRCEAARALTAATMSGHLILTSLGAIEGVDQHAEHANVPYVVLSGSLDRTRAARLLLLGDVRLIDHPTPTGRRRAAVATRATPTPTSPSRCAAVGHRADRDHDGRLRRSTTCASPVPTRCRCSATCSATMASGRWHPPQPRDRHLRRPGDHEDRRHRSRRITLAGCGCAHSGVGVLGAFRRGAFEWQRRVPRSVPATSCCSPARLAAAAVRRLHSPADPPNTSTIIIGAGRVGRAAAKRLADVGAVPHRRTARKTASAAP